jgi:hypothetical protein
MDQTKSLPARDVPPAPILDLSPGPKKGEMEIDLDKYYKT